MYRWRDKIIIPVLVLIERLPKRLRVFLIPFSFYLNALYDLFPSFRGSFTETHVEYESELDKNLYL
jgi:hypothetical protein